MIFKRNILFLFFLQIISFKIYCQNADSLNLILKQEKDDSLMLAAQLESLELKKTAGDKKGLSKSYHNIGSVYYDKKEYQTAIEYFMLSLIECREINDNIGIASCYQSMGDAHKNLKHYAEAVRYYSDAVDVYSELGYRNDMADCYTNISVIYEIKKIISQAISYTHKAQNAYTDKEKINECTKRLKYLRTK